MPVIGTATKDLREWLNSVETYANLQINMSWNTVTGLGLCLLEFTGNARKLWKNYRDIEALNGDLYHWDTRRM